MVVRTLQAMYKDMSQDGNGSERRPKEETQEWQAETSCAGL